MRSLRTRGLATFIQNPRDCTERKKYMGIEREKRHSTKYTETGREDMEFGIIENENLLRFARED